MMRNAILTLSLLLAAGASAHNGKHDNTTDKNAATPARKCALDCIKKGNPVGILANDVLYTVIMSGHESPNAKLAPFAGKQVVVTGTPNEKNGMHFVELEKIEEAPASKK